MIKRCNCNFLFAKRHPIRISLISNPINRQNKHKVRFKNFNRKEFHNRKFIFAKTLVLIYRQSSASIGLSLTGKISKVVVLNKQLKSRRD